MSNPRFCEELVFIDEINLDIQLNLILCIKPFFINIIPSLLYDFFLQSKVGGKDKSLPRESCYKIEHWIRWQQEKCIFIDSLSKLIVIDA